MEDSFLATGVGKLMNMNYEVSWKKKEFALISPHGVEIATVLQDDCPTVSEENAEQLIGELEHYAMEMNNRIQVLKSLHVEEMDGKVAAWLRQLKEMFPQVPDDELSPTSLVEMERMSHGTGG